MSLHFHRSELIPTIDFKDGGMLFVTDNEGTFPLRNPKRRKKIPIDNDDENDSVEADTVTFRSFDPNRDANKRRYKTRSQMRNDSASETGSQTVSTLSRKGKLRRRAKDNARLFDERRWSTASIGTANTGSTARNKVSKKMKGTISSRGSLRSNGYGSVGSAGTIRKRGELPNKQRSEDLQRAKNVENLKKAAAQKDEMAINRYLEELGHRSNGVSKKSQKIPFVDKLPKLERKIADEKLPWKLMIISSIILFILGLISAAINPWHHYYCLIWSSLLVFLQGFLGRWHDGDYLTPSKNMSYIASGIVAIISALVGSGLIMQSFGSICSLLAGGGSTKISYLQNIVTFSFHDKIALDVNKNYLVWITLSLDGLALVVYMFTFYCLSASMICLSNFWDASYTATGVCNHRGHPRIFNPMQQVSFSTACVFVGLLALALTESDRSHYYSPIWPGPIIMMSSILSVAAAKRPDAKTFNGFALLTQILCLLLCTSSTAFMTLALYEDSKAIEANKLDGNVLTSPLKAKLIASAAAETLFCIVIILSVIFIVGVTFRQGRNLYAQRSRNVQLTTNSSVNGFFRSTSGTNA